MNVVDPVRAERKMRAVAALFAFAMETKRHQLRRKHPRWTEREITKAAAALIERGCR
jgi:hypothetical protein